MSRRATVVEVLERYRRDDAGEVDRVRLADGRTAIRKTFSAAAAADFDAEVAALARVDAPEVTRILDAHREADGRGVLLREYVEGTSLRHALASLTPARRRAVLADVVAGLAAVHREGLVHGDLKPENVLLGESGPARLGDFGLAALAADGAAASKPAAGSAYYLPPERILGWPLDRRGDFFSFGVLLYELLGGALPDDAGRFYARFPRLPFEEAAPTDLAKLGSSPAAIALVRRLTSVDPSRRPADAAELLAELAAADLVDAARAGAGSRPRLPQDFFVRPLIDAIESALERAIGSAPPPRLLIDVADDEEALLLEHGVALAAARRGRRWMRAEELDASELSDRENDPPLVLGRATAELFAQLAPAIARGVPIAAVLHDQRGQRGQRVQRRELLPAPAWATALAVPRPDSAALALRLAGRDAPAGAVALPLLRLAEELLRRAGPSARRVERLIDELVAAGHVRASLRGVESAALDIPWDELARTAAQPLALPESARFAALLLLAAGEPLPEAVLRELLAAAGFAAGAARGALEQAGALLSTPGGLSLAPDAAIAPTPDELAHAHARLLEHEQRTSRRADRLFLHALRAGELDAAVACVVASRSELERRRADRWPPLLEELIERTHAFERGPPGLLYHAGELLLKAGRSARALELFAAARRIAAADPESATIERDALRRQGDAALLLGRFEEARACFDAGLQAARGTADELRFLRGLADALLRLGDAKGALALLASATRQVAAAPPRERHEFAPLHSLALLQLGRIEEAADLLRAAIAAVRPLGHPALLAVLLTNFSLAQWRGGKATAAIETAREALALQEERGQAHEVAALHQNLGVLQVDLCRFADARHHLESALELRRALGDARGVAVSEASLGRLALEQGLLAEARAHLVASAADLAQLGQPRERLLRQLGELRARFRSGAWRGVRREAQALRDAALQDAQVEVAAEAMQLLFERELAAGRVEAAAEEFSRLDRLLASERDARFAPALALRRAQLKRAAGDVEGALAVVEATRPRTSGTPLELEFALEEIALLGPPPPSERLEAAERLARARGQRRALVELLAFRAAWHSARGDRHGVAATLRELRETIADAIGVAPGAGRRELVRAALGMIATRAAAIRRAARAPADDEDEMAANLHLLRTFLSINKRLAGEADVPRLLEYLVETALSLTGAERGFIVLQRDGATVFEVSRSVRGGEIPAPERELSTTFLAQSLASGRPLVTSNAGLDPRFQNLRSVSALELRSILCVPIAVDATTRAALYLDHRLREGAFGDREIELAEALADQAGIALRNLGARQRIESLNERLSRRVEVQDTALTLAKRRVDRQGEVDVEDEEWIGASPAFLEASRQLERYAATELSVLVTGESGTGKERAARRLHELSRRRDRPFVSESCSAIPETLLESEFFGVRKGAFTGAENDRPGLFELVRGGTLFLDEIGEMPLALQAKLLRALEERSVRPLGAREPVAVDLRLVTATHRDLKELVREGRFREDLYYRVGAAELTLPPLRERRGDVRPLAERFLARLNATYGTRRSFPPAALERMDRYAWPGNVRQLKNEVHRAFAVAESDVLEWQPPAGEPLAASAGLRLPDPLPTLQELERILLSTALERHDWNKEAAARAIGISRASAYEKVRRYELRPDPGRRDTGG